MLKLPFPGAFMSSRRSFFVTGLCGALFGGSRTLKADAPSAVPPAGPFTVRADESHAGAPWILGGHYPVMAKVAGADTNGRYSLFQLVQPPNTGPALHIHTEQNEWFFVMSGTIGVKLGDKKIVLKAGDSLMAPKGVPHAYVTIGADDAHLLFLFDPAGDMEGHFAALSHIKRLADGRSDPEERAKAFAEHGMRMVGPPPQATEFS
jgi:quercetin dioxygenase-like cupin family protein